MEKQITDQKTDNVPTPPVSFAIKFIIVAFSLLYVSFILYLVVDSWVHEQAALKRFLGVPVETPFPPGFLSAVYAVLGSVLGAGVLGIVSFHRHVSIQQDFQTPHVWGYFVAPWLAAVLGLIVFALLQTGLLVFSGGGSSGPDSEISHMGYLAVGFLSGFGWVQAVEKIREVVKRFFAASPAQTRPSQEPPAPAGGDNGATAEATSTSGQKAAVVSSILKGTDKG